MSTNGFGTTKLRISKGVFITTVFLGRFFFFSPLRSVLGIYGGQREIPAVFKVVLLGKDTFSLEKKIKLPLLLKFFTEKAALYNQF